MMYDLEGSNNVDPLVSGFGQIIYNIHSYGRELFIERTCVCFITAGPITKLFAWGDEESGGHVL